MVRAYKSIDGRVARELVMVKRRRVLEVISLTVGALTLEAFTKSASVSAQAADAAGNTTYTPQSPSVAKGEVDVKQLLLLMDTDKNGRISRKEFIDFMEAEFNRLDTDKSGELDVKELEQSQLTTSHHGGTRR